jgi:hypothetical protein
MIRETEATETMAFLPDARIESCIFLVRGHKTMLDFHLAALYGTIPYRVKKRAKPYAGRNCRLAGPTAGEAVRDTTQCHS